MILNTFIHKGESIQCNHLTILHGLPTSDVDSFVDSISDVYETWIIGEHLWFNNNDYNVLLLKYIQKIDNRITEASGLTKCKFKINGVLCEIPQYNTVLKIIREILFTDKKIVIVKNPENGLHPKVISELAQIICELANDKQIIVETNSDHFINGVRLGIINKKLTNTKVSINFLTDDNVYLIFVTDSGRINIKELRMNDIQGFFDQFDTDISAVLGI